MIGYFKPDPSRQPPYGFYEGLIIAEVKSEEPKLVDVYQTKLYAEVFDAPFAYLISPKGIFDTSSSSVNKDDWYPEYPFKFP